MSYKKYNRQLFLSISLFAIVLWLIYVALSFVLIGNTMFETHGLIYIANSFAFTICSVSIINLFVLTLCALTIAFLIGNLLSNKEAINGIVNVVALGSSFLCGAFVPTEWLPDSVLKIAHILPSYWYIQNNETLKTLEIINFNTLKPILVNMGVLIGFAVVFIIIVTRKKRVVG